MNAMFEFLENEIPFTPQTAVVLGSGLNQFAGQLDNPVTISYADIPGYPQPSIQGHVGEFTCGTAGGTPVICARGRFHYYEGHPLDIVTLPIDVFSGIGCRQVIITNAAGCTRPDWHPGELMLISHIADFTFRDNCRTPEPMPVPESNLSRQARSVAARLDLILHEGTYCWTTGPTYETPAEINEIRKVNGAAVGMSTVPEIAKALELNLEVLGISCLTNYAAGIADQPLTHTEVLETTERVKADFASLVMGILEKSVY